MKSIKNLGFLGIALLAVGGIGVALTHPKGEAKVIQTETIKNPLETIHIKAENARIEIASTEEPQGKVELIGPEKRPKNLDFTIAQTGSELRITHKEKRHRLVAFDFFPNYDAIKLYLPERQYKQVTAITDNGRVAINKVQGETVKAKSSNGKIELANINGNTVEAETDNGKLRLDHVSADSIDTETENGKVELMYSEGKIKARTDNGAIIAELKKINHPLDLATDNGKISIMTEEKPSSMKVLAQSDNGSIRVFGKKYTQEMAAAESGPLLKLETDNGKIEIKEKRQ